MRKQPWLLVPVLLLLPVLAEATPTSPNVVKQAAQATALLKALKGLRPTALGGLALWRDHSLRSRETTRALREITTYLRAKTTLDPDSGTHHLRIAGTNLVITPEGRFMKVVNEATRPIGAGDVAGMAGEEIVGHILHAASQLRGGTQLKTLREGAPYYEFGDGE